MYQRASFILWLGLAVFTWPGAGAQTMISNLQPVNCQSEPLNFIFQKMEVKPINYQTPVLFANAVNELTVEVPSGQRGRVTLHGGLVSQFEAGTGVSFWLVTLATHGNIRLTAGRLFQSLPILYGLPEIENHGLDIYAVLLPGTKLASQGTASFLEFDVEAAWPQGDEPVQGTIELAGECNPDKGSYFNIATLIKSNGERDYRCICDGAKLSLTFVKKPGLFPFIRCDPNNDGRTNLADPIWLLRELYLGGLATRCKRAADCNADGRIDISDVIYGLNYVIRGGFPPPSPFPGCGAIEASPATLPCPPGSTRCPP